MTDAALALGRLALVAVFLIAGFAKLTGLAGTTAYVASKGLPAPQVLAVLAGLAEIGLGLLIAIGFKTRLAALGLAAFVVVATVIFHDFWNMAGDARITNQTQALKNLAIVGGLLVFAAIGAGRLSLDRR
jgi:putative oxidoreductase